MPRIFELRSCLQEVQDSLFASFDQHEHDSRSLKSTHPNPIKPDSNWLEDSFNPLGSESEIINIPGKGFFYWLTSFLLLRCKNVGVLFVKVFARLPLLCCFLKIVSFWALKMVRSRPNWAVVRIMVEKCIENYHNNKPRVIPGVPTSFRHEFSKKR